jgi:hypothetical protein
MGDRGEHDLCATEFRQFGGGVGGLGVDVVNRAELARKRLLVFPPSDGHRAESNFRRVLDTEVAEPTRSSSAR